MKFKNILLVSLLTVVGIQASEISNEAALAPACDCDRVDHETLINALWTAVEKTDFDQVKHIVEHCQKRGLSVDGMRMDDGTFNRITPLMKTCSMESAHLKYIPENSSNIPRVKEETAVAIARYLIKHGADVNAQFPLGVENPVHWALQHGTVRQVQLLLEAGAQLCPDSILMALCTYHDDRDEKIKLLQKYGADLKQTFNDNGSTVLHMAALQGDSKAVVYLLKKGFNVHAKDNEGHTPLHGAASGGSDLTVKLLLAAGARLDDEDNDGHSFADYAGNKLHLKHAVTLHDMRKNLDQQNEDGQTPLMLAAAIGDEETVKLILAGKQPKSKTKSGNKKKSAKALKPTLHLRDQHGFTALLHAARNHNTDIVMLLLEAGADIADRDDKGRDIFYWAEQGYFLDELQQRVNERDLMRVARQGLNEQETKAMHERQAQRTEEEQKAIEDLQTMIPGPGSGTGHINALIAQYVGGQAEQEESMEDEGIADLFPE